MVSAAKSSNQAPCCAIEIWISYSIILGLIIIFYNKNTNETRNHPIILIRNTVKYSKSRNYYGFVIECNLIEKKFYMLK